MRRKISTPIMPDLVTLTNPLDLFAAPNGEPVETVMPGEKIKIYRKARWKAWVQVEYKQQAAWAVTPHS